MVRESMGGRAVAFAGFVLVFTSGCGQTDDDAGSRGHGATDESAGAGSEAPEPEDPFGPGAGSEEPRTTNVIIDELRQGAVDSVDLLFVIDNSAGMAHKQALFAEALPDLVTRLSDPVCFSGTGDATPALDGSCPTGFTRQFQPVSDLHIGVITSSLGGFGSELDCTASERGQTDNAFLLGSLDRVRSELPATPSFLAWCPPGSNSEVTGACIVTPETANGDSSAFSAVLVDQVRAAGERGCGFEATLEAWYRFLVDPYPWTRIVRQNCPFGGDTQEGCVGPESDALGTPYIDEAILAQRKQFLRADSLLAVVMVTDENDCSFKASGESWRLSQTQRLSADGQAEVSRAYKGSAACQSDPNDSCCVSCGDQVPGGCPTVENVDGETVSAGCEEPLYMSSFDLAVEGSSEPTLDPPNLRCFDQKRRFGVDYLYPVARYVNALQLPTLCPFADDLNPEATNPDGSRVCGESQEFVVQNSLYTDLTFEDRRAADETATLVVPRDPSLVLLAGVVGVPWQDLAVDRNASTLLYRTNDASVTEEPTIDWTQLLGSATPGSPYDLRTAPPTDPLMWEQIDPRAGTDTSANGGEWNILERDDLQYACTFPLPERVSCPSLEELDGSDFRYCECTYHGDPAYQNPVCSGLEQTHSRAFPSIRPLQVLRDHGASSVVASICPKNTTDTNSSDYGYRPFVHALVGRMERELRAGCMGRELFVQDTPGGPAPNCTIVEANREATSCQAAEARADVAEPLGQRVRERLERLALCEAANGDCLDFQLCELAALTPGSEDYESCLAADNATGNGWCYVDPAQGLGSADQVAGCPVGEERRIRFAGSAAPRPGTVTFFACETAPVPAE
jgi:hypothetical protein